MRNHFEIRGDQAIIYAGAQSQTMEILIDAKDIHIAQSVSHWHLSQGQNTLYAVARQRANGRLRTVLLHRLLLSPPIDMVVDHINRNGLDNRRDNLRVVTQAVNLQNIPFADKDTATGFRGVQPPKSGGKWAGKYAAEATKFGRKHNLGHYDTKEEAQDAVIRFWKDGTYTEIALAEHAEAEKVRCTHEVRFDTETGKWTVVAVNSIGRIILYCCDNREQAYWAKSHFDEHRLPGKHPVLG